MTKKTFDEIRAGDSHRMEFTITQAAYDALVNIFGDTSAVHVDASYCRSKGFESPVMHGAILNGFISRFVGTEFPGTDVLELAVDLRYLKPSYLGDRLALTGSIEQKTEAQRALVLRVEFENLTRGTVVARGRVQMTIL